jgi:hypothetical protein
MALLHQLRNYQIYNETPENEGVKYEGTDREPDAVVSQCGRGYCNTIFI